MDQKKEEPIEIGPVISDLINFNIQPKKKQM